MESTEGTGEKLKSLWGPWSEAIDPIERKAQLRCLAGLVRCMTGGQVNLVRALRWAEPPIITGLASAHDGIKIGIAAISLTEARHLFDALPTLDQRRIIATFAAVNAPISSKQMRPTLEDDMGRDYHLQSATRNDIKNQ